MKRFFSKELIERPRVGHEKKYKDTRRGTRSSLEGFLRPRQKFLAGELEDYEDYGPRKVGMLGSHRGARMGTKQFNDLISPLRRWLVRQVGRPWDDVWSEICQTLKGNGLQANHVKDHVRFEVGGIPHSGRTYFKPEDWFTDQRRLVYVDARGILRKGKSYGQRFYRPEKKTYPHVSESETVEYHQLHGCWYRVELAKVSGVEGFRAQLKNLSYFVVRHQALSRREVKRLKLEERLSSKPSKIESLEEYLKPWHPPKA